MDADIKPVLEHLNGAALRPLCFVDIPHLEIEVEEVVEVFYNKRTRFIDCVHVRAEEDGFTLVLEGVLESRSLAVYAIRPVNKGLLRREENGATVELRG